MTTGTICRLILVISYLVIICIVNISKNNTIKSLEKVFEDVIKNFEAKNKKKPNDFTLVQLNMDQEDRKFLINLFANKIKLNVGIFLTSLMLLSLFVLD